jgi:GTP-binding protein
VTYAHTLKAPDGQHGMGKDCYGKGGEDLICRVPVGTQVFTRDTHELLFDLKEAHQRVVIAKGGKGGRGNMHFATPYDRAPRQAEHGMPGEEKLLRLELKVMADVGLLGFPNVGKSTFIRACSRAQPKVADYPFTTLVPHLGVVRIDDEASFVLADIPGLIPGAAEGAGLGIRFLQHVERTRALLHLVTLDPGEGRDPVTDYDALVKELSAYDKELARRPTIVAMTKADLPEVQEAFVKAKAAFKKKKIDLRLVSAATGEGVRQLLIDLFRLTRSQPGTDAGSPPSHPEAGIPRRHPEARIPRRHPEARSAEGSPTQATQGILRAYGPQDDRKAAPKRKPTPKRKAAAASKKKPKMPKRKPIPKKKPKKRKATPRVKGR